MATFLNFFLHSFFQPADPLKQFPWFQGPLDKKVAENALKSFSKVCLFVKVFRIISSAFSDS